MPELRRDPLTGRWVSYAPERAKRPVEMGEKAPPLVDEPLAEALKKFDEEKVIQLNVTDKDFKVLAERVGEAFETGVERELSQSIDWIKVLESLGLLDDVLEYLSRYGGGENLF